MLIITRRAGEKIRVSNDICIEVIEVTGSTVRIGIAAPRSIPVYRGDLGGRPGRERRGGQGPRRAPRRARSGEQQLPKQDLT